MAARKATGTQKTTEALKDVASDNVFATDFLVHLDDSSKVPAEVHESNKASVVASALQRGLRATADVEVKSEKVVDKHNVEIVYTVAVEPNTAE